MSRQPGGIMVGDSNNYIILNQSDAAKVTAGDQFQLGGSFLSGQNAGFEGGIGNWQVNANCTLAGPAAPGHTGANSRRLTAAGTLPQPHSAHGPRPPAPGGGGLPGGLGV